ncbi:alpha/beta hydrolase [Clostridium sp. C8-1-8]|uniref:alpha/beta hydrolase n=1 Tax=Clostridium sp. C8-1-8 TaxID=2698831 RepID=UPI0013715994|nr:alpha/beta hydrolase [Clostridium sp. C8-1-8]
MIEPLDCPYEDFPETEATTEGVQIISTNSEDRYLEYRENVIYVSRDGLDLRLQIIIPTYFDMRGKKFPCIVYVQGSAWMKQNLYANIPQLSKFAERGYVMALVEYRPSQVAPFPAQVQDVKTAIRYLRKNASEYNIDSNNIAVWGDSSGGHTAVLVGITQEMENIDVEEYSEYSAKVNAVIDYYGPTDITKMNEVASIADHISSDSPEGLLIGGVNVIENKGKAEKTNPINYISKEKTIPPILIMHGNKDPLVPFEQSILFYEALKAHDKESDFYKLKGAYHGGPQFWTDTVLDIVEDFVKKNCNY